MQKNLAVSSSPHLRDNVTTRRIMQEVCLALAPAGIAAIVLFGASAATLIAASVITAVLAEFCWNKLNKQKTTVGDWSAVVTGLLLAYNLPANAPVWIAVVGAIIAIILVKQMFGGIGSNFMNPALAARAILFVSWSSLMTSYPATQFMTDVTSSATPLNLLGKGTVEGVNLMDLFLGNVPGVLGETCKLALLLGGVYLILRGIVDLENPCHLHCHGICVLSGEGRRGNGSVPDFVRRSVPRRVLHGDGLRHQPRDQCGSSHHGRGLRSVPVRDSRLRLLSRGMLLCHPADERCDAFDRQVHHAQGLWGGEEAWLISRARVSGRFS